MKTLVEVLANTPLFKGFSVTDIEQIAAQAKISHFAKSCVVFNRGDATDSFYVILKGKVNVVLKNDKGRTIIINTLEEYDSFGELAPLGKIPRQASIVTTQQSTFGIISRQVFMAAVLTKPEASPHIIDLLIHRIQDLTEEVSSLALDNVYNRVTRMLYKNASQINGKWVTEKLTQQNIADRVGATREMVHRIFKELKYGNYISIEHGRITIEKQLPHDR